MAGDGWLWPIQGRRWRKRARRRALDSIAQLEPVSLLTAASAFGRLCYRLRGRPSSGDVRRLFEGQSSAAANRAETIAREMSAMHSRNRMMGALVARRGLAPALALLAPGSLAALENLRDQSQPTVFVTFHLGPSCGISAAFERLAIVSLGIARRRQQAVVADDRIAGVDRREATRTAALWRAVQQLRSGGNVVIAADGALGERTEEVACLGRVIRLARGPFVLARLSGAPLVPIISTWTREGLIGVELGAPIDSSRPPGDGTDFEHASASATAAWFERRLLASPEQLRPRTLRWLVSAPRLGESPVTPLDAQA